MSEADSRRQSERGALHRAAACSYRMLEKLSKNDAMDWERIISAVRGSEMAKVWWEFKHSALVAHATRFPGKASTPATQARLQAPAEAFRLNQV